MPRVHRGAFPTDLAMDEGYPDDAMVKEIELICANDAERWIREVLPVIWELIPHAFVRTSETTDIMDRPAVEIRLSTGGWSGAESVIYAVLRNLWLARFCREQRQGGGYTFVVRAAAV